MREWKMRVETAGEDCIRYCKSEKYRSGKLRSENVWKAVKTKRKNKNYYYT